MAGGLQRPYAIRDFICSNRVTLEHPYYNSPQGRKEWNAKKETILKAERSGGNVRITEEEDGVVLVHCEIELPAKFHEFEKETQRDKN